MPDFDFINLIVLLLAGTSAGIFFYLNKKTVIDAQNNTDIQEKSYSTLHSATQKAQDILGMAELDALKVTTDSRFYKEKMEGKIEAIMKQEVQKSIDEFNQFLGNLKTGLEKSNKEYINYLSYLKTDADSQKNQNQDTLRAQIEAIFVKFEENLSQFLVESQQRSVQTLELELKSTRQLIETYKEQQLKLVDENIIAMLERTLSLVLTKKLSLQDQIDLVYEALEKAKAEKFIG